MMNFDFKGLIVILIGFSSNLTYASEDLKANTHQLPSDHNQKRKIEQLILQDSFKSALPKIAVGLGIFYVAVLYDYHQKVYKNEIPDQALEVDASEEEAYNLLKAAYHIIELSLTNRFLLGSLCASIGGEGIRATFDGAQYLLGKLFGSRNLDSQTEIDRNLLTIQMEMKDKISRGEIPKVACKHLEKTLDQSIFPKQSIDRLDHDALISIRSYWAALKALPHEPISIHFEEAWRALAPILENFDVQFQQTLKVFIKKLSIPPEKLARCEDKCEATLDTKHILYLLGDTAVGKTTFANNLAKTLHIPIAKIRMGDCKERNFLGKFYYHDSRSICVTFNGQSELTSALVKMSGQHGILLLDEAGKTLNNEKDREFPELQAVLLDLLDPDNKTIFLRDLGVDVDISGLVIILTGNEPIKSEHLRSRMHTIRFKGFSKDTKLQDDSCSFRTLWS